MTAHISAGLKALGDSKTVYQFDKITPGLLEFFRTPFYTKDSPVDLQSDSFVHIKCPEFTSLCPKTGQPDFATIVIQYTPRERCVESKSLKLYLNSFRSVGEFHESCVQRIAEDLWQLLDPIDLMVRGEFTPRGGIPFWPTVQLRAHDAD